MPVANKKAATNGQVTIPKAEVERLLDKLAEAAKGDLDSQIDVKLSDKTMQALLAGVNGLVASLAEHGEEYRESTMTLALGLSDCFQVLAQVRGGDMSARVSDYTITCGDDLMGQLGQTLNDTIGDLDKQIETIHKQQSAIEHLVKQLQTPILQLWDDVLALPVIGMVDSKRSAEMMETLLTEITNRQCKYVILDITGVEIVDTKTADHFVKVMKSAELLGTKCIMTGIRPAVAQTLVELGVDLSSIRTLRNLQEGLRECLREMDNRKSVGVAAVK